MHEASMQVEGVTMFESFISDTSRGIAPMKGFEDSPDGSWFGSFKVDNEAVWQMIKDGKVMGFSVEGIFEYTRQKSKEQQIMSAIYQILKQVDFGGPGSGRNPEGENPEDGNQEIKYGTNKKENLDKTVEYGQKNGLKILISDKIPNNQTAIGSPSNQIIYINPKSKYWDNPIENQKAAFEKGILSSPNPLHVINHEQSHLIHKNAAQYWQYKDYQQQIASKVSQYAKTNPSEFLAETYAGLKSGIKYDTDVMNLYKIQGGTEIKK
jgi:hypothetical protein